jgi:predicted dehydrogenase
MTKIGIIGLGMMGRTHYEAYQKIPDAQVVAIADADAKRAAGNLAGTAGNILDGGLSQLPMDRIKGFTDYRQLIALPELDIIDVCVPTPSHLEVAVAALATGKNVLCEKPLGRTLADAQQIAKAAESAKGFFMPAMCMRFWPGWDWLKQAVSDKRFGKLVSVTFRRIASMPGGWYRNGEMSGGAALDLHIHDVDFVYHLFGRPNAIFSRGYAKTTGKTDHLVSHYLYDGGPLVVAEGGWCLSDGFGFSMTYIANFDNATAEFNMANKNALTVSKDGKQEFPALAAGTGYEGELAYFVDCVAKKQKPTRVTAADGVEGVRMVEAEIRSIESGQVVKLDEAAKSR